MAYKGHRPDLMGRILAAFNGSYLGSEGWPSYTVTVREMAKHLGGQDWTQIGECFTQLVKEGKLTSSHIGRGVDTKYHINDHIPPWEGKVQPGYQARCPRCKQPIQGRHGRRKRQGHDDDKCDFDTTKLIVDG